jgi:hypothetical protein
MNEVLESLFSTLMIAHANFRTIHWLSCGEEFDRQHALAEQFVGMTNGDVDTVAEIILRYQPSVPTIADALQSPVGNELLKSSTPIGYDSFLALVRAQFTSIMNAIIAVLKQDIIQNDIRLVGIKSDFEAMYSRYDLQLRYLNKRRMINN